MEYNIAAKEWMLEPSTLSLIDEQPGQLSYHTIP